MSTFPEYTYNHNRRPVWRGDTLKAVQFKVVQETTLIPVVPLSVCAQIRSKYDVLIHTYVAEIYPDGVVVLPDVVADWPSGEYRYDVEYRLDNDITRTYFTGTITVKGDVAKCS